MKNFLLLFIFWLLCSCVSYYDEYEYSYNVNTWTGYSYYNSPLRLRGLNTTDFYMLDHHPKDYFTTQLWGTAGNLSQFAIHNMFQILTH